MPSGARRPYVQIFPGAEGRGRHSFETEPLVYVHYWHDYERAVWELAARLDWLDGYTVAEYGDLVGGRYTRASRVPAHDGGVYHLVDTLEVRAGSKRRLEAS